MASVVDVKTAPVKVESFKLEVTASEARDIQTYIRAYYKNNGYGNGYERNVNLYNVVTAGLAGKVDPGF